MSPYCECHSAVTVVGELVTRVGTLNSQTYIFEALQLLIDLKH